MSDEIARTKQYYQRNAAKWTALKTNSFHHESEFRRFRQHLSTHNRVLDVGCASGIHLPLFLGIGRGLHYTGVDISSEFLMIARNRYPHHDFLLGNLADFDTLPHGPFHGIWCAATLMHVPEQHWGLCLSNLYRLLSNQGVLYLTLPTEHPSKEPAEDPRHFTLLPHRKQRAKLLEAGFKIVYDGTIDGFAKSGIWQTYLVQKT